MPSGVRSRSLARDLRRLARACTIAAAAGPGCFLFFPCVDDGTHMETRPVTEQRLEWYAAAPSGGPFTGSWLADDSLRLGGPGGVQRSFDAGESWDELPFAPEGIAAVDGIDGWETWMVGADGLAGVWHDGAFVPGELDGSPDLRDVSVDDGWGAVAVGADGAVYASEDGSAWALDPEPAELAGAATLRAVELLSDRSTWIVGDAGLILHDGGEGWESVDLGTDAELRDVAFASANRGFVIGAGGAAWWTADAGDSWTAAPTPGEATALAFSGAEGQELRLAAGPDGIVWSFDGAVWAEVARTSDGSALSTLAAFGETALAAGELALMLGWVQYEVEESVEVSNCQPYVGRPYLVDGEPRLADVRDAPADADPRWLRRAQEEHGAVAAFARFASQLRRLGAPAELVAAALAAQDDERRHTDLALAMAGGGHLPTSCHTDDDASLVQVAVATVREGCIAETAAVYAAMEGVIRSIGAERRAWRTLVRDETRHAALAWGFIRWALGEDPAVREAVRPLFTERPAHVPEAVWRRVIRPSSEALLG